MNALRSISSLFVLLAAPLVAQDAAPRHLLRMAFEPGKPAWYRQSVDMSSTMKIGGQDMVTGMKMAVVLRTEVLEVTGGKASMRHTFERITAKMDNPMMKVDYDSDDPDSRPGALAILEDVVGESLQVQVDDHGRFSDAKPSAGFPEQASEMFGGGELNRFLGQNVPELPDQPVAIGESWQTTTEMPMGPTGNAKVTVTNTLMEVGGGRARIRQVMSVDVDDLKVPGGGQMQMDKAEGFTVLDLATGMPIESEMQMVSKVVNTQVSMDMSMTLRVDAVPAPAAKAVPATDAKDGE
ncbi:MAG: DUF6263 family protein [Planctomycetota bacterium]